jgi:probable phosphoglycerate mutase
MGNVFFVRHGEAETNKNDVLSSDYDGYPLTENGRSQVSATAEQLQGIMFDRAYSSPVLRARQTAEILLEGRGIEPKVDERLRERGMGEMEGKQAHNGNWIIPMLRKREYSLGVESFQDMAERTLSFIDAVPKEGNTLVATHESPISVLACSILGLVEFNGKGIKVGNASVTVITVSENEKPGLLALGSYSIDSLYFEDIANRSRHSH